MIWFLAAAWAADTYVPLSGVASDASGAPLQGTHALTFGVYASASGGSPLYAEASSAAFIDGAFSVILGESTTDDEAAWASAGGLWVEMSVDGGAPSARTPVGWVARASYADRARTADTLGSLDPSDVALADHTHAFSALTGLSSSTEWPGTSAFARLTGLTASTEWPGTSAFARLTGLTASTVWPGTVPWSRVTGSAHTHTASEISDFTAAVTAIAGSVGGGGSLAVSSLNDGDGPAAGGQTVLITGAGFVSGVSVTFGGIPGTSVVVIDATHLQVVAPASSAPGTAVAVTVTAPGGASASLANAWTPKKDGSTSALAATSCKVIKAVNPSAATGLYWINPDNTSATQVRCDMSIDGGGWIVCAQQSLATNGNYLGRTMLNSVVASPTTSGATFASDCAGLMKRLRPGGSVEFGLHGDQSGEWQWVWPLSVEDTYSRWKGNNDSGSCDPTPVTLCKGSATANAVTVVKYSACHNSGQHRTGDSYFIWQIGDSINAGTLMEIAQGDPNHPVGIRPDCRSDGTWHSCGLAAGSPRAYATPSQCGTSNRTQNTVRVMFREHD